jgi:hypothetical protein
MDALGERVGLRGNYYGTQSGTLSQLILLNDVGKLSDEEFDREIREIASCRDDTEWSGPERYEEDIRKEEELRKKRSKRK